MEQITKHRMVMFVYFTAGIFMMFNSVIFFFGSTQFIEQEKGIYLIIVALWCFWIAGDFVGFSGKHYRKIKGVLKDE